MALTASTGTAVALAPKGTRLRVRIANGHRPQLDSIIEGNPGKSAAIAAQQWVSQRYGNWITGNLPGSFAFENVCPTCFDVVFASPADARAFQAAIGGQEVANAA